MGRKRGAGLLYANIPAQEDKELVPGEGSMTSLYYRPVYNEGLIKPILLLEGELKPWLKRKEKEELAIVNQAI